MCKQHNLAIYFRLLSNAKLVKVIVIYPVFVKIIFYENIITELVLRHF